jgi:hypothetical protein
LVEVDLHDAMMIDAIASAPEFPTGSAHFLSHQFRALARRQCPPLTPIK